MEEATQPTIKSTAVKWGVINGLISIIFFVVVDFAGQAGNQAVSWLGGVIFLVLVILAHREFKNEGDGFMSFGQGLGLGTLIAVISSIISSVFTFIYVSFINTNFIDAIREKSIADMEESGQSQAQIDQAMPFVEMFTSPAAMLIIGILFGVFFGFIISLLVTIFTKNQDPEAI